MDLHVMLPWELEEDILSRLPPKSLVQFRAVSKRWNSLISDKSFINKHLSLSRPQFIFQTLSKVYSIDIINQSIDLRELHTSCRHHIKGLFNGHRRLNSEYLCITTCDDLLFCTYPLCLKKDTVLWNPWLRHVNWIKLSVDEKFNVVCLGYDSSGPQKIHKILLSMRYFFHHRVAIYECASHALRFIGTHRPNDIMPISVIDKRSHVSLYGNLYWIFYNRLTHECSIESFDFTREIFKSVCLLPIQDSHSCDERVLAVFKGGRLSFLKQCYLTRKIEIWVMKNEIYDKEEVVWIHLMTLTANNLPKLSDMILAVSYFIYDETLFMCCGDGRSQPCIYVVKGDMCNKIQICSGELGAPAGVSALGFEPWPLQNLHMDCSIRDRRSL
ncbi:unnamed protein product [Eruca vesicaria subsp. sativa]|uniref:F-box domain-containing protein n=1 Tax=Eruca vesicaria subsp. sativa TaxID=29727 RepID=A0ABC8M0H1_ERUVS|nr:unnamed protein product [Eruca vesicaria subsp. sativa]